ncbi:MAG TPA: serine/threonine-protein kinase [Vicinamibacteria bacterium]
MICPTCQQPNSEQAEACFTCGKALYALVQGAVVASRYVVREPLGRGGMGHVYRAYDNVLDEDVAIKVLRADLASADELHRRFRSEIRLARKVTHPNVCRIHEYGEDGGLRYLSMEFVRGVDLKRWLRGRALPPAAAYEVAIQAARGLEAVHAHGVIHRDLKPSNITVDFRGVVRLMDFGIAKEAETPAALTGSGTLVGTPEYMSPEQAAGAPLDYASDVYSLGCVIYEAFTGTPPFRGDTPVGTLYMHVHHPPGLEGPGAVDLPAALRPILGRSLAKSPADRGTAAGLAEALGQARDASGVPAGDLAAAARALVEPDGAAREGTPSPPMPPGAGAADVFRQETRTSTARSRAPGARDGRTRRGGPSRRWRWGFVAVSTVAVGALVATGLQSRAPVPAAEAPPSAPAEVVPAARGPAPEEDRREPTAAPAPPAAVARGASRPGPAVPRPVPTSLPTAPPAALLPAPRSYQGLLSLVIVPEAEVTVDGISLGLVSRREVPLEPGPHAVRILHPHYQPLQRKVTIRSGVTQRLVLDLSEKAVRREP